MHDLQIHPIDHRRPAEALALHRLLQAAYTEEARLIGVAHFPPLSRTVDDIVQSSSHFFGCREAGALIAAVELADQPTETGAVGIDSLAVLPSHFRRGLATALMAHVAAMPGLTHLSVSTASKNVPAIDLYSKLGFHVAGTSRHAGGIDLVHLERAL